MAILSKWNKSRKGHKKGLYHKKAHFSEGVLNEKGSITIFAMILIPTILFLFFTIILKIDERNVQTTSLTVATQASEVRMSKYNGQVYDTYRLLTYETTDQLPEILDLMKEENNLNGKVSYTVQEKTLDQPFYFKEAVLKAAHVEVSKEVAQMAIEWLTSFEAIQGDTLKVQEVNEVRKNLANKMNIKEWQSFSKALTTLDDVSKLQGVYQKYEDLNKNLNTLKDIYSKALDDLSDNPYMSETQDVKEHLDYLEAKITLMEKSWQSLLEIGDQVQSCQRTINLLKSDLNALEDAVSKANEDQNEDQNDNTTGRGDAISDSSHLDALNREIKTIKDDISRLEDNITLLNDAFEEETASFRVLGKQMEDYFNEGQSQKGLIDTLKDLAKHIQNDIEQAFVKIDDGVDYTDLEQVDIEDYGQVTLLDKAFIIEYCLGVFKSADEKSPRNFDFIGHKADRKDLEIEYLLSGRGNLKDRQTSISLKLFALRLVSNTFAIIFDRDSMVWLQNISATLPIPHRYIGQGIIIGTWSSAESYLDIQTLKDGEGLPPIKQMADFELKLAKGLDPIVGQLDEAIDIMEDAFELESDANQNRSNQSGPIGEQSDKLMYYQDYMRLLFQLQRIDVTLSRLERLMAFDLGTTLDQYAIGHTIEIKVSEGQEYALEKTYD